MTIGPGAIVPLHSHEDWPAFNVANDRKPKTMQKMGWML